VWGEKNMPAIDAPIRRFKCIIHPVTGMPCISVRIGASLAACGIGLNAASLPAEEARDAQ
jgi:hypothetical protein